MVASGAFQNEGLIYMAYANGADYDAVASILGATAPSARGCPSRLHASPEAAVAERGI